MYANVNSTKIFFDIEGQGLVPDGPIMRQKPVCFVLHGGPGGDHTAYKPGLTPISEWMQLVYIDNRGSGLSETGPQSTYTLENNVEDVEALRRYLGLEKIVLLGQSYGGMTALRYAAKYPQNIEGLLLITTSPSSQFIERAKQFVEEKGNAEQKKAADNLWQGFESEEQLDEFYQAMAPLYSYTYDPKTAAEDPERKNAKLRSNRSREALNEGFGGFLRSYNVIPDLPSIKAPTLVIGARHDWITPVEETFVIAKHIPNNELVIFEKSGHSVMKDEYEHFLSTVSDFVQRKLVNR
jgi:proline iminopeptidase